MDANFHPSLTGDKKMWGTGSWGATSLTSSSPSSWGKGQDDLTPSTTEGSNLKKGWIRGYLAGLPYASSAVGDSLLSTVLRASEDQMFDLRGPTGLG